MTLNLIVLKNKLAIIRLSREASIPSWVDLEGSSFLSITKTLDELSIVCDQLSIPSNVDHPSLDWRAFKVEGPLDFSLTGILSSLALPLAEHKISIFAISTYDTDYILVKEKDLDEAIKILGKSCTVKT